MRQEIEIKHIVKKSDDITKLYFVSQMYNNNNKTNTINANVISTYFSVQYFVQTLNNANTT